MKIQIDVTPTLVAEAALKDDIDKTATDVAKELGVSKSKVLEALNEPSVKKTIRAFGGVGNITKAALKITALAATTLKKPFEKITETKALKKLQSGALKVDDFLDQHPKLKGITGLALAGMMYRGWTLMTFIGDLDYDFDFTTIAEYAAGEKGVADLLASPDGLMFTALFATGAVLGLGFGWAGTTALNTGIGLVYTGAKHLKNKTGGELLEKLNKNPYIKSVRDVSEKALNKIGKPFVDSFRKQKNNKNTWWDRLTRKQQKSYVDKYKNTKYKVTAK